MTTTMTGSPTASLSRISPESAGQAGKTGRKRKPGVGTKRRQLKVMIKFRAYPETIKALKILQTVLTCTRTKAIEVSVARLAAYVAPSVGTNNNGGVDE